MARIAQFRRILKDDFFKRIKFFAKFLSARDILDAAAAKNYHWRNRIWTPIQTLWAFLVQVLEPDCSCREAVARILAEQIQSRDEGGSLTMRIAYLHAIRDSHHLTNQDFGWEKSLLTYRTCELRFSAVKHSVGFLRLMTFFTIQRKEQEQQT